MSTGKVISISGVSDSGAAAVAAHICNNKKGQSLVIVPSNSGTRKFADDLSFFVDREVLVMPEENESFIKYEAKDREKLFARMKILKALRTGEDCIVVAPVSAALKKIPPAASYEQNRLIFVRGEEMDFEECKRKISSMGYERQTMIEGRGQFAIRGDIIDIFTPDSEVPFRVEFFGDEIDSIRSFDPDSQRSLDNLKSASVYPAEHFTADDEIFKKAAEKVEKEYNRQIKRLTTKLEEADSTEKKKRLESACTNLEKSKEQLKEYIINISNLQYLENYVHYFYDETEQLWDYLQNGQIILNDIDRIIETATVDYREKKADFEVQLERGEVVPKDLNAFASEKDLSRIYEGREVYVMTPFSKRIPGVSTLSEAYNIKCRIGISFNGKIDLITKELKQYAKEGYEITIVSADKDRIESIKTMIRDMDLEGKISVKEGNLSESVIFSEEKIYFVSEKDIFSSLVKKKRKKKKLSGGQPIKSFADIKKGDFVVHENHGIGKFLGIEQLTVRGEKSDYLKIKYAGKDLLYVPVDSMDIVQKYIGGDTARPKLNKLSGSEWKKTKAKAKADIANMARDLLQVSAERQSRPGFAFEPDDEWQRDFENDFPYQETDDQLRCIKEIKKDMEAPFAMDRLLCGDVGFGKTEVAARALFKCVENGKQAAVLVPTTILANQHYYTLKERFEKFPFKVEVLSRFKTAAEQKMIMDRVERGEVDLVIGTHRLLSKDIRFKDLGLLVIDEEQRFGVEHKEKIKMLKSNIDVLTLSATPIPRTLHMSLVGIRNMSLIEEPPEDRVPVQTYVLEQEDDVIRNCIRREISRGGQVYVVYNRVNGIQQVASKIEELVPEASVIVGHGQMNEKNLEKIMLSFINGENDVLVATTIIESGLDIPNANTLIILDADCYGLSQLYQLRGRVGRTTKSAYAYLMHKQGKVLSETSTHRLRAIKEFTEFGSGFKVAMRDLEIRGAGNLLGVEQSGHMMNIGYELYCKLVDDAVRALKGEIVSENREEMVVELNVSAYIPNKYISEEVLKLQMYKKIATVATAEDEDIVIDELIDRFGDVPRATLNLIKVARIRALAMDLCIASIGEEQGKVVFRFEETNKLTGPILATLSQKYGMKVFFHGGIKPFMRLTVDNKTKLAETVEFLETLKNANAAEDMVKSPQN